VAMAALAEVIDCSPPAKQSKSKSPDSQRRKTGNAGSGRSQGTPQVKVQKGDTAPPQRLIAWSPAKQAGTAAQQGAEHCGDLSVESHWSPLPTGTLPLVDEYTDYCGDFMDDVKLRADVTRLKKSGKPARCGNPSIRDSSEFPEASHRKGSPQTTQRSPGSERISEGSREFSSPEDQVCLDLSEIMQAKAEGCPVLGSEDGRSLDDSMMGASVDESFEREGGIGQVAMPETRLFDSRPNKEMALKNASARDAGHCAQIQPQPNRTVFFPAPPVSAASTVFHKGHYQGWSQRSTTSRSLSPPALLGV